MMELDELGIMCATGSACSASKEEASHVCEAVGLTESQARSSLRFTMGRGTTLDEVIYTVNMLAKILTD
jgi:cysteine desulfurase